MLRGSSEIESTLPLFYGRVARQRTLKADFHCSYIEYFMDLMSNNPKEMELHFDLIARLIIKDIL